MQIKLNAVNLCILCEILPYQMSSTFCKKMSEKLLLWFAEPIFAPTVYFLWGIIFTDRFICYRVSSAESMGTNVMVVVRINTLHWDKLNRDMRPASSRLVGSPHPCVSIKLQSAQSISTILDTTKKWTCIACLGLCSREMSHVIFCHTIKKDCIIAKVQ